MAKIVEFKVDDFTSSSGYVALNPDQIVSVHADHGDNAVVTTADGKVWETNEKYAAAVKAILAP